GKDHQRPSPRNQDVDGIVDRLAIGTLAIDAEGSKSPQHGPLVPTFLEQVPACHREDVTPQLSGQQAEHQGIAHPRMVGANQNAIACIYRLPQPLDVATVVGGNPKNLAEKLAMAETQQPDPPIRLD